MGSIFRQLEQDDAQMDFQLGLDDLSSVRCRLLPGAILPSVRQLAHDLGVAPNTVVRAYSELEREGWVVTEARHGVIVAPYSPMLAAKARARELERAVTQLLVTAHQLGVTPAELHVEIDRLLRR